MQGIKGLKAIKKPLEGELELQALKRWNSKDYRDWYKKKLCLRVLSTDFNVSIPKIMILGIVPCE